MFISFKFKLTNPLIFCWSNSLITQNCCHNLWWLNVDGAYVCTDIAYDWLITISIFENYQYVIKKYFYDLISVNISCAVCCLMVKFVCLINWNVVEQTIILVCPCNMWLVLVSVSIRLLMGCDLPGYVDIIEEKVFTFLI